MTANLKKSMNPHGCVEKWKCDFPIISHTSSPSWHVPFLLQKGTCHIIFSPTSSPSLLPHGLFLFWCKKEHAKTCSTVNQILLTHPLIPCIDADLCRSVYMFDQACWGFRGRTWLHNLDQQMA